MQLGGIGNDHSAEMHQVTSCMHGHDHAERGAAGMRLGPGAAARQVLQTNQEQQVQFSLGDWAQRLFRTGKQKLFMFWNGNENAVLGEKAGKPQTAAQINAANPADVSKTFELQKEGAILQNSPYFAAVPARQPQAAAQTLPRRLKLKLGSIAGQLAKHLPEKFFGFQKNGSFQTKKEGGKEDLRRRSKYRENDLEIDCILTDESYLLDSYDRNGEYSRLTTANRP